MLCRVVSIMLFLDINSLAPRRCGNVVKNETSEHMLQIKFKNIFYEIPVKWTLVTITNFR